MMIFVKSLTARTIALEVDLAESVASVCSKIQVRRFTGVLCQDDEYDGICIHRNEENICNCRTGSLFLAIFGVLCMLGNN